MAQESWTEYLVKFSAKVGLKIALNLSAPGFGSAVDFFQAVQCLWDGDILGFTINTVSGVADVATFGLLGATKEVMKESAKGAVVQTAKETAKSASKQVTKKVGQDLGKQWAKGLITGGKDAAIQTAKETAKAASKEATKQVGQQVGKEIAKGVITETVEEVWHEGTKMTFNQLLQTGVLGAVSSGGKEVAKTTSEDVFEALLTSGIEKIFYEASKQGTKFAGFEFTKEAAKTAAKEEFMKNSVKFIAKDVWVALVKRAIHLHHEEKEIERLYYQTNRAWSM